MVVKDPFLKKRLLALEKESGVPGIWTAFHRERTNIRLRDEGHDMDAHYEARRIFDPTAGGSVAKAQKLGLLGGVSEDIGAKFDELHDVLLEESGKVNIHRDLLWVYSNAGSNPDDIDPETIPGKGALNLLKATQGDRQFYLKLVEKILPSKAEIDNINKFSDDGREVLSLLDKVKKAALKALNIEKQITEA